MRDYFDEMFSVFAAAGYAPDDVYNMLKPFFFRNQFNKELVTKAELEELFESKKEYYDYIFNCGIALSKEKKEHVK